MKVCYKEIIEGFSVIRSISDAAADPEKTKQKIKPMITDGMSEADIENLYMQNLVYAIVGSEAELMEDHIAESVQEKLINAGSNQLLLDNGEYIDDYRGVEYWIEKAGKLVKEKIEKIDVKLPDTAIMQENLSKEQQELITRLNESDRIANLTDDQKKTEKDSKLHALAREAIMKSEEAELLDEPFDKKAWLLPRKLEIEKIYA